MRVRMRMTVLLRVWFVVFMRMQIVVVVSMVRRMVVVPVLIPGR